MNNKNNYGLYFVDKKGNDILYATYKNYEMLQKAILSDEIFWERVKKEGTAIKIIELLEEKEVKAVS